MKQDTDVKAGVFEFLGKLLLASIAISVAIKGAGPQLNLPEAGINNGAALAIVLSLPLAVGLLLLLRWQQSA